jgi:hypothetical protein
MRRRGRTDTNQTEIVTALRGVGVHVQSLADIGDGCPDLLVSFRGKWFVFEVKSPRGKLTPDETKWHNAARASVFLAYSADEAIRVLERETTI